MNRFLQLGVNKEGRDFVIGDIHGKYDELMYGLESVGFNFDEDRLLAVGDLIDRGLQNMQCLGLIYEPWFYTIIGNHELMMCDALGTTPAPYQGSNAMRHWTTNGGHWYHVLDEEEIQSLKNVYIPLILEELPVAIELLTQGGKRVGITHAGLPYAWSWTTTRLHLQELQGITDRVVVECTWTRTRVSNTNMKHADILGIDLLISGHTPTPVPVWRGNNVFIDQGVYTNELIPLLIEDLITEEAKQNEKE